MFSSNPEPGGLRQRNRLLADGRVRFLPVVVGHAVGLDINTVRSSVRSHDVACVVTYVAGNIDGSIGTATVRATRRKEPQRK